MKIKEIFTSIQGEGPFVGYKQLFIRFCGCNLNCNYCDTEFNNSDAKDYTKEELLYICNNTEDCHSISLTGGEPLLHINFLKEFLQEVHLPIYLETNATLCENLKEIIKYVDIISADIKLPSCTGLSSKFNIHEQFFEIAKGKTLFAKIVFNERITADEIDKCCELGKKFNIELILQPIMINDKLGIKTEFIPQILDKFLEKYKKVRVIPQVHKFISCK